MKLNILFLVFFIIIGHVTKAQKIDNDSIAYITLFAIDPHRVLTFSNVNASRFVFELEHQTKQENLVSENFIRIISKKKQVKKLVSNINCLSVCYPGSIEEFNARMVLQINYLDGEKVLIVLEDVLSQRILAFSNECKPNKRLYKNVLAFLPRKWRKNVKLQTTDNCGIVFDLDNK